MTQPQQKCIELYLWKRPDSIPESEWITIDQWKALKDEIDTGTASDIIGSFKNGNHGLAVAQMLHLIEKI